MSRLCPMGSVVGDLEDTQRDPPPPPSHLCLGQMHLQEHPSKHLSGTKNTGWGGLRAPLPRSLCAISNIPVVINISKPIVFTVVKWIGNKTYHEAHGVLARYYTTIAAIYTLNILIGPKETLFPFAVNSLFSVPCPWGPLIHSLSPQMCLFGTCHTNGILRNVDFGVCSLPDRWALKVHPRSSIPSCD